MTSGGSEGTDVIVIDSFTVVVRRGRDGGYASEVTNLPGCGAEAPSVDELVARTRGAIASFLSGGREP
jgi:predicted RNase H-like HicB family nuclease